MIRVHGIPAFSDNYIWCIYHEHTKQALLVDPGSYDDALSFLMDNQLKLTAILVTHHHPDHTGGISKLKKAYDCTCIASHQSKVSHIDQKLSDGEMIELMGLPIRSIDVPGHTLDHNAYYIENIRALFCGDTIFSGGCGRLFEGSARQMHHSLQKIQQLPHDTRLYCAHEYTQSNLKFAAHLMPKNPALKSYIETVENLRSLGQPTIPSEIKIELDINPFLRSNDSELINNLRKKYPEMPDEEIEVFTATRLAKDEF